jgi:phage tail-like protein
MPSSVQFDLNPRFSSRLPASGRNPDPVGELRFLVDVPQIAGASKIGVFSECSGLEVEYEVYEWTEGGQNDFVHKLRGRAKFPNLTLKRGITHEDAFLRWLFACNNKTERHDIVISLIGPDLKAVRKWSFAGAYPVKWTGPKLDAHSTGAATESLEIAHQGFRLGV